MCMHLDLKDLRIGSHNWGETVSSVWRILYIQNDTPV